MQTFLTEYRTNWRLFSGPNVLAVDWDEAEITAKLISCKLTVVGVLVCEY